MNFRKINIRHASGVHTLQVKAKEFDKVYKKITGIIKGKNKQFRHSSRDGALQLFPAEMLRQSVITFEPQKEGSGLIQQ
ncbi:hypothetical protein [Chryseobacterium sp. Leaf201]|uniref:hypothetical protein n=1 Tax=Chryseobacterium sp. Leaf201 TaxID=1735672 RepID=UPI000700DC95|nr:hypothetical protein [Chryseobacterium sp. Leaf201]KQM45898.1 hypothetical protein ASE55_11730 [Chryseobacterium sp. Leaf201]